MSLVGLAKKFVDMHVLDQKQAEDLASQSQAQNNSFITTLVEQKILSYQEIATQLADNHGLPVFDLDVLNMDLMPIKDIPAHLVDKLHVIPLFRRGNKLFIGTADPTDLNALDELQQACQTKLHSVVVEENKLIDLIDKLGISHNVAFDNLEKELGALLDEIESSTSEESLTASRDDTPVVKFINKVLVDAIAQNASDIHFEPYEKVYRIRFRKDGVLHQTFTPPTHLSARIASRLKVMSNLDISERRIPQDGRFKIRASRHKVIDFRISTCPTLFGEKVVLRILDPSSVQIGLDDLGYEEAQKQTFIRNIHKPQGMILVTGPTGSGKTVSLYTAINLLNTLERNISTCEDPVEINLEGVNQVTVNLKAHLTFATALRSFLRQDPDIIMVGEIRDLETAEIAVKAAQTGHMVLSTLHTNTATDTLNRLINMGIPYYNLATSICMVVSQRLARKLCPNCRQPTTKSKEILKNAGFSERQLETAEIFEAGDGCSLCNNGYKGRIGLYEILEVNEEIRNMIMMQASVIEIEKKAIAAGMWTLRYSGLEKVALGITSLEEIFRVTRE